MRISFIIALGILALGLGACASLSDSHPASLAPGTLVARLALRDYVVAIYTGHDGLRYDVGGPNGELVASSVSLDELRGKVPEVYELVRRAIAVDAGSDSHNWMRVDSRVE
jgi:hypothetical protein